MDVWYADNEAETPGGSGAKLGSATVISAGFFAISATLVSLTSIWMQLKHYRKPILQRYVVRILIMVPLYAISSLVSLVSLKAAFYIDAVRDIYESFVLYCFFALLVNYLGGERSLLIMLHGRPPKQHLWPVSIFSPEMDLSDPYTFLFLKRGIFQYVYIKPVLAILTMALKWTGKYQEGYISAGSGYFWISLIYNVSVATSLYCLAMFWVATSSDLKPFRPMPKFLSIKAIIFFSFWQGFAISLLVYIGFIHSAGPYTADNISLAVQDALICFEMPFAALMHWYAFSHKDYADAFFSQTARLPVYYALRDAFGMRDVVEDSLQTVRGTGFSYRTFEPAEGGVVHVGRGRDKRIAAGLRYKHGGKDKYWVDDADGERQGLISEQSAAARPKRRASSHIDLEFDAPDDNEDELYKDARRLEHGDYNYPSIEDDSRPGEHDDDDENDGLLNQVKKTWEDATGLGKREREIEYETRQKMYEQHPYLRPKSQRRDSASTSTPASPDSEPPKSPDCVDLVVEDPDAEERELARRRRDGGPMPSKVPKKFKVLVPDMTEPSEVAPTPARTVEASEGNLPNEESAANPHAAPIETGKLEDGGRPKSDGHEENSTEEGPFQVGDEEDNIWK